MLMPPRFFNDRLIIFGASFLNAATPKSISTKVSLFYRMISSATAASGTGLCI
jgi:hypothetical protein